MADDILDAQIAAEDAAEPNATAVALALDGASSRPELSHAIARYAPNWGRLHLKWGEASWWNGHEDDARKQFDIASKLDLAPPEKLEVARMKAGHGG